MLRRCIGELSLGRSIGKRHRPIIPQTSSFLSSGNGFSTAPPKNPPKGPSPGPAQETSGSGSSFSKLVLGSVFVGAAVMAAYQTGYIDIGVKNEKFRSDDLDSHHATVPGMEKPTELKLNTEAFEKNEHHPLKDSDVNSETLPENKSTEQNTVPAEENGLSSLAKDTLPIEQTVVSEQSAESNLNLPSEQTVSLEQSAEINPNLDNNIRTHLEENKQAENSKTENNEMVSSAQVSEESAMSEGPHQDASVQMAKVAVDDGKESVKSPADPYSLHADEAVSGEREQTNTLAAFIDKEVSAAQSGNLMNENRSNDMKVVFDFIEAVHAAERRQAETDAYIFIEEKQKLKEKYEKELKDARARELMYAEEAAILDKELNKEKVKAAAAIKSLQEKAEQKLQEELQRKEEEADIQSRKAQELAKAELAAAIASEKASQIEKISEANLNIDALCMAFFARSEEAQQTHSVHKLALGTLALEDALSRGLPIRSEVHELHKSLEGIDRDSLLDLVLSSLPEEALNYGIDTHVQLNQKFDSLKGTLRHFSLIPAGGGGLLAHTVAHIASSIKMKEDQSGDGIESVISKVESFLVQGKFAEAADALEFGVRGSEAEEVIVEWVKQARNRAVIEQGLSVLQSYATSITFS